MNTAKRLLCLALFLLVSACATPSPPPVIVTEKLPPLSAQELQIAPPSTGAYSAKLTSYLEKVKAWRLSSQQQLSSTPAR